MTEVHNRRRSSRRDIAVFIDSWEGVETSDAPAENGEKKRGFPNERRSSRRDIAVFIDSWEGAEARDSPAESGEKKRGFLKRFASRNSLKKKELGESQSETDNTEMSYTSYDVEMLDETDNGIGKSFISPQAFLDTLLESRGYSTQRHYALKTGYYSEPTLYQLASYHPHLIRLARDGKYQDLKQLLEMGISSNPCNGEGESLIHAVCQSDKPETLQVLLDAGSTVQVSDKYGRNPLHFACVRSRSCFEIIEKILDQDLHLLYIADSRGALPLSYVPRAEWPRWLNFIESKKDCWWKPMSSAVVPRQPFTSLADLPPNSRPVPDPKNSLDLKLAEMVAAGKLRQDLLRGGL